MSKKKKNKNEQDSQIQPKPFILYDEKFQTDEYKERERIIDMLNELNTIEAEEVKCNPGEHYVVVNEFGVPQCADCLTLFSWRGVRRELFASNLPDDEVARRYKELKKIIRQIENGNPPKNIVNWNDYRYLTGFGYQYIERWFYERD